MSEKQEPCKTCGTPLKFNGSMKDDVETKKIHQICRECGNPVKGTSFKCKNCETYYCIRCALWISDKEEQCRKCGELLSF
ncbi:MAG: hypothetical protein ACFFCS_26830 [Candidatus Hodarchaeota archaeon]